MSEEPNAPKRKLAQADLDVLRSAATGEDLIQITSREQFNALGEAAVATHKAFGECPVVTGMTEAQACRVRKWRVDDGCSWRAVAEEAYAAWRGDWQPPSNQLMGMVLCERAAEILGENYMEQPWN